MLLKHKHEKEGYFVCRRFIYEKRFGYCCRHIISSLVHLAEGAAEEAAEAEVAGWDQHIRTEGLRSLDLRVVSW